MSDWQLGSERRNSLLGIGRRGIRYLRTMSLVGAMCFSGCRPLGQPGGDGSTGLVTAVRLRLVADGLTSPLGMVVPPDGSRRLFIVDQIGFIRIVDSEGVLVEEPFLDLRDQLVEIMPGYDERGLLGLAFHPNYAENGRFFVLYHARADQNTADVDYEVDSLERVSEFRVTATEDSADSGSERVLFELPKPQFNHNGGQLAFSPIDNYLYISVGDGGGANDNEEGHNPDIGNGQDKSTLFGKILRIDVDGEEPYQIPPDNPFVDQLDVRPEIWAYGLRNPWRFSFDRDDPTRMFIADVGQDLFEEVSLGQVGGNYGWSIREGTQCFSASSPTDPPSDCPRVGPDGNALIEPIFDYSHIDDAGEVIRTSITGGYVYRGSLIPGLAGQYIFGDYSAGFESGDGTLLAAVENSDRSWSIRELSIDGVEDGRIRLFVRSFGEDPDGELFVLTTRELGPSGTSGQVFKLEAAPN